MTDYKKLDIEVVHHLGSLGYSLEEINKMTDKEIEEHCITEEDVDQCIEELIASQGQY